VTIESKEINEIRVIDENGIDLPWSYMFFILHKHCHLDKCKIMDYTLPQIVELMEECNKYMQFEVSTRMPMMPMLGVPGDQGGESEDGFKEATEDDINELARFLGGG
jgi:hypothetical protein